MIQKTTMKRYDATTKQWHPIYLANSADITYLGNGFTVASGAGFSLKQEIPGTTDINELLVEIINNLAKIDKVTIPAIQDGSGVTNVPASSIEGTIDRGNLPADIGGKGIPVESEDAKDALTADQINTGDIVKVDGGKVYLVTSTDPEITYMALSDSASEVDWTRVTNTPTTLEGYGITDAMASSDKVTEATVENAGKLLALNDEGELDVDITGNAETLGGHEPAFYAIKTDLDAANLEITATKTNVETLQGQIKAIDASWITSGTIDLARIPAAAIETLYITENATTLAAVTKEQVQNGDTIKVAATGLMYFVVDDTKLGTADYMQGLVAYTAGTASSVDWSGVINKPTTLQGYGITDAVAADEKVTEGTVANAGKIVVLGADGKLNTSITGDAATVGGLKPSDLATAEALQNLADQIGGGDSGIAKDVADLKATVGDAESGLVKDVTTLTADMTTAKTDITNLKSGDAVNALAASKITGTLSYSQLPAGVGGKTHKYDTLDDAAAALTPENAHEGDLVKLADGRVYVITDTIKLNSTDGYTVVVDMANGKLSWANITDAPTTVEGYGITDAVKTADTADAGGAAAAGKVAKADADGKLAFSITGDAATVGGLGAADIAKAADLTNLTNIIGDAESGISKDVADLKTELKDIDAAWITKGTISIERLPHGALERCVVVATDEARKALTTAQVQTGDTVKVTATGMMYFVVDDTKLAEDAGYEVYTAGTASAVDWSGVANKPTTLQGYGITDAIAATEKVTEASAANAGKILVLNAEGKLDADITGHVGWANITDAPTSTVEQIDTAVAAATHTNRAVLDALADENGTLTYNGNAVAMKSHVDEVSLGSLKIVEADALPEDAANGQLILEAIGGGSNNVTYSLTDLFAETYGISIDQSRLGLHYGSGYFEVPGITNTSTFAYVIEQYNRGLRDESMTMSLNTKTGRLIITNNTGSLVNYKFQYSDGTILYDSTTDQ